jgi:arsenate reductase
MKHTFIIANGPYRKKAIELIRENDLPTEDLENKQVYVLVNDRNELIGTGGLEYFGNEALIRSVSIKKDQQGKGLGKLVTAELEKMATSQGVRILYLLTTTAKDFFQKEGYQVIPRDSVSQQVKESSEFSTVCPSTATVMKKELTPKKKILFVCVENSNRSQMSQAFAKMLGGDRIEAYSAGSKPSGIVNPKAIMAMKELGYELGKHESKSLEEVKQFAPFDAVVTMGCGDACPWMPAKKFVDWEIPDPKHMEPAEFNKVRDMIRSKVKDLIETL